MSVSMPWKAPYILVAVLLHRIEAYALLPDDKIACRFEMPIHCDLSRTAIWLESLGNLRKYVSRYVIIARIDFFPQSSFLHCFKSSFLLVQQATRITMGHTHFSTVRPQSLHLPSHEISPIVWLGNHWAAKSQISSYCKNGFDQKVKQEYPVWHEITPPVLRRAGQSWRCWTWRLWCLHERCGPHNWTVTYRGRVAQKSQKQYVLPRIECDAGSRYFEPLRRRWRVEYHNLKSNIWSKPKVSFTEDSSDLNSDSCDAPPSWLPALLVPRF